MFKKLDVQSDGRNIFLNKISTTRHFNGINNKILKSSYIADNNQFLLDEYKWKDQKSSRIIHSKFKLFS